MMASHLYNSYNKQQWREHNLSLLTVDNTIRLVNEDNSLRYKWLEAIGQDAITFDNLLKTGRIKQEQLIGIDKDPKKEEQSRINIENCKLKFPKVKFVSEYWDAYCEYQAPNDIGVINHDLFDSCYGNVFERNLRGTVILAEKCYKNIGEVFVIINADLTSSQRYGKNASIDDFIKTIKSVFKNNATDPNMKELSINPKQVYSYKNNSQSSTMISVSILFH